MPNNKLAQHSDASTNIQVAALMRTHLMFFLPWVFKVLHPGHEPLILEWYLRAICQAFYKVAAGRTRRLVINVPPRHLKSITSVAFVAWMLGRDPRLKFMLVTYGSKLSRDHLINLTRIMNHRFYPSLTCVSAGRRSTAGSPVSTPSSSNTHVPMIAPDGC